ncbi:MAG: hypothetical protein AAF927_05980 [Bacteroidota bacterium]
MDPNFVTNYFLGRIFDKTGEILKPKVEAYLELIKPYLIEKSERQQSSCLIGFGRCGGNICEYVQEKIDEAISQEGEGNRNRLSRLLSAQNLRPLSVNPLIFTVDLDMHAFNEKSLIGERNSRFNPIELESKGGAGHLQVSGEHQAYKYLSVAPETINSKNWQNFFTFLVNTAGLKINPTKMYFYIFSSGGGTGSGMSSVFGRAQKYAISERIREASKTNNIKLRESLKDDKVGLVDAPPFSHSLCVLPNIPNKLKLHNHIFLNTGRLLCRLLSNLYLENHPQSSPPSAKGVRSNAFPWNCMTLISNYSFAQQLEGESLEPSVSIGKFEKITNDFVAQQIQNLLLAQIDPKEVSKKDWEKYGIGRSEIIKLDPADLRTNLWGLNMVAYNEKSTKEAKKHPISQLFLDSLQPPSISAGASKDAPIVRGLSLMPIKAEKYRGIFEVESIEKRIKALAKIPAFRRATSILTVISLPSEDFKAEERDFTKLKKYNTQIFENAKSRRYAIILSPRNEMNITTFICGSAVCLSQEILMHLSNYLSRVFNDKSISGQALEKLFYSFINPCLDLTKEERLEKLNQFASHLLEQEDLQVYTTLPMDKFKEEEEGLYAISDPKGRLKIDELAVRKEEVLNALTEIIEIMDHEIEQNVPFELEPVLY